MKYIVFLFLVFLTVSCAPQQEKEFIAPAKYHIIGTNDGNWTRDIDVWADSFQMDRLDYIRYWDNGKQADLYAKRFKIFQQTKYAK